MHRTNARSPAVTSGGVPGPVQAGQTVWVHYSLVGTTASGKSDLAMAIIDAFPGVFEVVSVDSMQVYRGMDIGTAKPDADDQAKVAHHLIDVLDPGDDFTLSDFQTAAWSAIEGIEGRGKRALLVGGTGLYLQAVLDRFAIPGRFEKVRESFEGQETTALWAQLNDLDPLSASRMEPTNRRRVERALEVTLGSGKPFSSFGPGVDVYEEQSFRQIGLWIPRALNSDRIEIRIDAMLEAGWLFEVRRLMEGQWSRNARQALGYPELEKVLRGEMSKEDARVQIVSKTKEFARRQRMWFRRDPRITWFGTDDNREGLRGAVLRDCENWLSKSGGEP